MTKLNISGLTEQIEQLVHAHITAVRVEAAAAVQRAFAAIDGKAMKAPRKPRGAKLGKRRSDVEMEELAERFHQVLCDMPGESMRVLAQKVDATSQELFRPVNRLRQAGRVRTVGQRRDTRYFPLAVTNAGVAV